MLEGFKAIRDRGTLLAVALRIHDIHVKILREQPLIEEEIRDLRLYLFADGDPDRILIDEDHRLQLMDQWWKDAKHHNKSLKKQEEK